MKLCRFELRNDPGVSRSGIYHDGRFYETDGENAVGVHDPGSIKFLAPTGLPPAVRLFDPYRAMDGSERLTYTYYHPGRLQAPATELDATGSELALDFEVRVAALIQDGDPKLGPSEAARMLLGFGILVTLFNSDDREELAAVGLSTAPANDVGGIFGPFLVTPDELTDNKTTADPNEFAWPVKIYVNGELLHQEIEPPEYSVFDVVSVASRKSPIVAGEILAWPAFKKPSLESSNLGRYLIPTDKITVEIEPLGNLTTRII